VLNEEYHSSIAAAAKVSLGFLWFHPSQPLFNMKKVQIIPVATSKQFKNSNLKTSFSCSIYNFKPNQGIVSLKITLIFEPASSI